MLTLDDTRIGRLEVAAGVAFGLALALIGVAAAVQDADPWNQVGVVAVAGAGYVLGREVGRLGPLPAAVVGLALAVATALTLSVGTSTWSGPEAGPLGYANASAALAVQGAAAAGLATVVSEHRQVRLLAALLCAALCTVPLFLGSAAGSLCGGLVLVVTVLVASGRALSPARFAAWGGLAVFAVVGGTVLLGASGSAPAALESVLSSRRPQLWAVALDVIVAEPLWGVGPGNLDAITTGRLGDGDARPAHSLLLNVAAESGVLAALALIALAIVVLVLLASAPGRHLGAAMVGIASWVSFTLQSAVDYIAHFPQVVVLTAVVIGLAMTEARE